MSKKKVKIHHYPLAPFRYGIVFSEEAYHAFCKRNGLTPETFPSRANAMEVSYPECTLSLVVMNHDPTLTATEQVGLMAHEAVHVLDRLMEFMGERDVGKEIRAYGVQRILMDFIYAYKEHYGIT